MPRPVPFAVLTIAFDKQWLTSLTKRFSRPLRFLSSRFADFVPFFWSFCRKRLKRART